MTTKEAYEFEKAQLDKIMIENNNIPCGVREDSLEGWTWMENVFSQIARRIKNCLELKRKMVQEEQLVNQPLGGEQEYPREDEEV